MRALSTALALTLAVLLLPDCGGTQKAVEADWSDAPEEKPKKLRDTETLAAPTPTPTPEPLAAGPSGARAPLGVRHDLMLSDRAHPVRCNCLSVEAGPSTDPNLFWIGGAPEIGPAAIAVAIGARGIDCPGGSADEGRRRPSISAVDQVNDDIILEVEDLPEGRPLASGAIIPRPGAAGSIYIHPRSPNQAYGKGAPGGRCKVR
jgi:hypothetical protein